MIYSLHKTIDSLIKLLTARHRLIIRHIWRRLEFVVFQQRRRRRRIIFDVRKAVFRVPPVVAVGPGQGVDEWVSQVEHGPRDDHVVVGAQPERDHNCRYSGTCKIWKELSFIFLQITEMWVWVITKNRGSQTFLYRNPFQNIFKFL